MPRRRSVPTIEEELQPVDPEEELETAESPDDAGWRPRAPWYWRWAGGLVVLAVVLTASFELAYWNKIYPGVVVNGADLSGLSRAAADARLAEKISDFSGQTLPIKYGDTTLRIPVHDLGVQYDTTQALAQAYRYGRQGSWQQRIREQLRSILGRPTVLAHYSYRDSKLTPYLYQISDDVATPVQDARLAYGDNRAEVTPAADGRRLNLGRLVNLVEDRLAATDSSPITAPVYALPPRVSTASLERIAGQADTYLAGPVTLSYGDVIKEIPRSVITSWLKVDYQPERDFLTTRDIKDLYPPTAAINLTVNRPAITAYIAELAGRIDQTPRNAALSMDNGQIAIASPSQTGVSLDQPGSVDAILKTLDRPADDRKITLELKTTRPAVREDNLAELGIKELISEGVTMFPGSSKARLTNVRTGASKFNNVLLAPGEIFSFGKLLGEVGPETGYEPELVILANHEEKQYGGGLCQVSSTAFRAALNAGLPIVERHNHSFAVSYYTAPYGVPGVDATIYYPQLDFKFKNDTPGYILIQTIFSGTTLKFEYYGTKTKSGVIRGPEFITGSNDATQPSHTVFYRDILDMDGKVVKTDTFHTHYKSSKDFPIQTSGYN